jgi:hypothetical protein
LGWTLLVWHFRGRTLCSANDLSCSLFVLRTGPCLSHVWRFGPDIATSVQILHAYKQMCSQGSGSDQSTGRDVLQSLSERDPAVSVNVQSLVVSNSSVGNLVYSYEGDSSLTVVSGNDTTNPLPESALEQKARLPSLGTVAVSHLTLSLVAV